MVMPSALEYDHAMLAWERRTRLVAVPHLTNGSVFLVPNSPRKKPWKSVGGFAAVYRFITGDGRTVAVRCFLADLPTDAKRRTEAIAEAFGRDLPRSTVSIALHHAAVEVATAHDTANPACYPILEMEWIDGVSLHQWVHDRVTRGESAALIQTFEAWTELIEQMQAARIAHCDLSADNVMVRPDGSLVLIDYDEAFVPSLAGTRNLAGKGTRGFQHPEFFKGGGRHYDEHADNFSALLIGTALRGIAIHPDLWRSPYIIEQGGRLQSTNLLFRQDDLDDPDGVGSDLFAALGQSSDQTVRELSERLRDTCRAPLASVPVVDLRPAPPALREMRVALRDRDDAAILRTLRRLSVDLTREGRLTGADWREIGLARRRQQARAAIQQAGRDPRRLTEAWLLYGGLPPGAASWAPSTPMAWAADDPRLDALLDDLAGHP
ncbi:MAG: hypothetical protein IT305_25355 [Chloroflexi bacterium]|nr:hypothetical protein [Chloroflexota bacterium]